MTRPQLNIRNHLKRSSMGQVTQHQPDHRGKDRGFARRAEPLVVLAQAATVPEPTARALNHPAAGQYTPNLPGSERLPIDDRPDRGPHAARLLGMSDYFHTPAQVRLDPGLATPRVALIAPHM